MADPDIRLGGTNSMFPSISCSFICWRGAKVYSQTGWGGHGRISPSPGFCHEEK